MYRKAMVGVLLITGCEAAEEDELSVSEALMALDELGSSSRGEEATRDVIEVNTDFTLGDAVEAYAQALADFWESQAPCTEVTLAPPTLTVDYGALGDACVWRGHTYAGVNTTTVQEVALDRLVVENRWSAFRNEDLQVDGGDTVTHLAGSGQRAVVGAHTWTDTATGETVDVEVDHTWGWLDPASPVLGGYTLEGNRSWTSETGTWQLEMRGVEIRLQDPFPQAGTFDLELPDGRALVMTSRRLDETTIEVVLDGLAEPLVFHVGPFGVPELVDEE